MHTNVRWMPPEVIAERTFSNASDVWSFGILQWEMFWPNRHPYHKMGNLEVATKVCEVVGGDRVGYNISVQYRAAAFDVTGCKTTGTPSVIFHFTDK